MKKQNLTLFVVSLLSIVILASFTSAALIYTPSTLSRTVSQGESLTATINVENNAVADDFTAISYEFSTFTSGSNTLSTSNLVLTGLPTQINNSDSITITLNVNAPLTQALGTYSGNLTIKGNYTQEYSYSLPITITVTSAQEDWENNFCVYENGISGNPGDLDISIDNIQVSDNSFGDDESWFPFDTVEVELLVENNNDDYDIDNIEVEWGLYDEESNEWVIDVDNEDDLDLKDGDDETLTFTFTIDDDLDVDLEDLEDGDHYVLYVRATGEVDNDNNDDTCDADSEQVEIVVEKDFVVAANIDLDSETVSCGDTLHVTSDIYNIGSRDQDEISVRASIRELNYDEEFTIGDINSFENENLEFDVIIPKNADEKTYALVFEVYDEDNDIYVNDFDDDEARTTTSFTVSGCSATPGDSDQPGEGETPSIIVSANLESGGKAGEDLIINAMLTNTGDNEAELVLNAAGYANWADSATLDKTTLTLEKGESGEVTIVLNVKKDVSGDQLFKLEVVSDDELVASQPISVTIQKSSGFGLGNNWYIWLIGALNLILIIIIIAVAVRIARKK